MIFKIDQEAALAWIQAEYSKRKRSNERYSIRAFSRLLEMDSSTVSQILSGKRNLSGNTLTKMIGSLGGSIDRFIATRFVSGNTESGNYGTLRSDVFEAISEWYHFAILELSETDDFILDEKKASEALGISQADARIAIRRLKRLKLLKDHNGRLRKTQRDITNFDREISTPALRNLQRAVIQFAERSLDEDPVQLRDHSSMSMAIDPEKLPEAKKMITDFRRKLCAFLESGKKQQVYHLGIQLYPVSKKRTFNQINHLRKGEEK